MIKKIISILQLAMFTLFIAGFTSCSDDSEKEAFDISLLMGNWESVDAGKDYNILAFKSDYTGAEYYGISSTNYYVDNFAYTFDSSSKELRITYHYEDGEYDYVICRIANLTSTKLVLEDIYDGEKVEYKKYYGPIPPNNGGGNNGGDDDEPTGQIAAPQNVRATAGSDGITVSWDAVNGASYYKVYRSSTYNGNYTYIGGINATSGLDAYPMQGYNYYKITAVSSSAESEFSNYAYAYYANSGSGEDNTGGNTGGNTGDNTGGNTGGGATSKVPDAPTGVTVSNEGNNYYPYVVVRWNEVNGADKYYIYRSTSANGSYSKIGEATYGSYVDNSAPTNKSSYYKVKAVNSAGTSAYSSYAEYTPVSNDEAFGPCYTYGNCTVSGYNMTLRWTYKTGTGYGKATKAVLRIYNPYTEEWEDKQELSGTATSVTFSFSGYVGDGGFVKVGIIASNAVDSFSSMKVWDVNEKKWLM